MSGRAASLKLCKRPSSSVPRHPNQLRELWINQTICWENLYSRDMIFENRINGGRSQDENNTENFFTKMCQFRTLLALFFRRS